MTEETNPKAKKHPAIERIEEAGRARAAAQGDEFSEADFLMGAAAALEAAVGAGAAPAWWFLGVASGRPVLLDTQTHERIVQAREDARIAVAERRRLMPLLIRAQNLISNQLAWSERGRELAEELENMGWVR